MIPFIFLCFSNGISLPKESFLREKLAEFGNILSVLMRPSYSQNLKSFVLIEFSTVVNLDNGQEEALVCRRHYNRAEDAESKKQKLGDKRLEVNILIGSKVMRPFEANIVQANLNTQYSSASKFSS